MALTMTEVSKLYISIFGRASEEEGNTYWQSKSTISSAATDMLATTAAATYFGSSLSTNQAFIEHIYLNTLGKTYTQDKAGIDYWVEALKTNSKGSVISNLIAAAQSTANAGNAQNQFNNRVELSNYYATQVKQNDMSITTNIINATTYDLATLERAKSDLNTFKITFAASYTLQVLTSGADTFNGTTAKEWIYGLDGNDVIYTGSGENVAYGDAGDDRIYGLDKKDTLHGGIGNDTIYGGAENDTLYGDAGNDSLVGDAGDDVIWGDDGNDYVYGNVGNDTLRGGTGDDTIIGDVGNDFIYGESGSDWIDAGIGINWVDGGSGNDTIFGGAEVDQLFGGEDNDTIYGLDGNDILDGMNGNDIVYGGNGDDSITGNEGIDILYGNAGNDYLKGELGSDTLYGGIGTDILSGGEGADVFVFELGDSTTTTLDTIVDFSFLAAGFDMLKLINLGSENIVSSAINVNSAATLASALTLVTTSGDSAGVNAQISWFVFGDNTYVYEDMVVGAYDATTDIIIKLQGIVNLNGIDSNSFIFA